MKQLLTYIGIIISILSIAIPASAAVEFEYGNFKFIVTNTADLTCSVSGLTESGQELESIQIPEIVDFLNKDFTVTTIHDEAFRGNETVKSVNLPSSITSIGGYAFYGCSNLSDINLSDNITTIGENAFDSCSSIKKLKIPEALTLIDEYAFDDTAIEEVHVSSIDKWVSITFKKDSFDHNLRLSSNPLSSGVTKLFVNGELLEHLITPEDKEIPSYAFVYYPYLQSAKINGNCGSKVFYNCTNLEEITVAGNVTNLCSFEKCSNLSSVTLEDGNENIYIDYSRNSNGVDYNSAFYDTNIEYLYLGRNITDDRSDSHFPLSHFSQLETLKHVIIGTYVSSLYNRIDNNPIEELIFKDSDIALKITGFSSRGHCFDTKKLNKLYIGRRLSSSSNFTKWFDPYELISVHFGKNGSLGQSSINAGCTNLRDVSIDDETPPSSNIEFSTDTYIYGTLTVPQGCKSAYQSVEPWKNFWNIVEADTQSEIEDIVPHNFSIQTYGTTISIQGAEDERIDIYSISGIKVYSGYNSSIDLRTKGVYIVCIGNKSQKILL